MLTTSVSLRRPEAAFESRPLDDVVPHLTVADSHGGADLAAMRAVERTAQASLPIRAHLDTVLVIAGTTEPNSWRVLQELRLATGSSTP